MSDDTPTKPSGKRPASNVTLEERTEVLRTLGELGWPIRELEVSIRIESGWRSDARNPTSDASGLIQLMPSWLLREGFGEGTARERAAQFRALKVLDQLPWYKLYYQRVNRPWRVPGDTYLALAAPSYVGAADSHVIYAVGSKAWQQNPAWRSSPLGPITAGSIRALLLRRMTP